HRHTLDRIQPRHAATRLGRLSGVRLGDRCDHASGLHEHLLQHHLGGVRRPVVDRDRWHGYHAVLDVWLHHRRRRHLLGSFHGADHRLWCCSRRRHRTRYRDHHQRWWPRSGDLCPHHGRRDLHAAEGVLHHGYPDRDPQDGPLHPQRGEHRTLVLRDGAERRRHSRERRHLDGRFWPRPLVM